MSLIAHRVIDALLGADPKYPMMPAPGITEEMRLRTSTMIREAQKFDFGALVCEPQPEKGPGVWELPSLTEDEREFFRLGLIPLPYPVCWYEFVLGGWRSAILVYEKEAGWHLERFDLVQENEVLYSGVVVKCNLATAAPKGEPGSWEATMGGNHQFMRVVEKANMLEHYHFGSELPLAAYLTLMLNSKTTEVEFQEAPKKLNKVRQKKAREPLPDHRIVRIVPARFQYEKDPLTGGTHRSPRLHWRRSHLRHYDHHTPNSQWAAHAWHQGEEGWWVAVIPRMLVGRAELGEVSHEYRIEQPQKEGP